MQPCEAGGRTARTAGILQLHFRCSEGGEMVWTRFTLGESCMKWGKRNSASVDDFGNTVQEEKFLRDDVKEQGVN